MLERFDIDLNDEADELLDSIDDMIFDDDDDDLDDIQISAGATGESSLPEDDDDDTISEEDLEKLLIGIDEENGILDIPDEEEVLEELKFVDELPRASSKPKAQKKEKKAKKEKKSKKEKTEKGDKEPIKFNLPKIEMGELKEKLFKFKFHIAAVLVAFLVFTGVFIKLMSGKNQKVDTQVFQEETVATAIELSDEIIEENLSSEEQLAVYRGKLKSEEIPEEKREELVAKLEEVQERIREEKIEERDEFINDINIEFEEKLETIKPTLFKFQGENLIIGFVIENYIEEKIYSDVYSAIVDAFEKNSDVETINVNIFAVEDQLRMKVEITAVRYEFERIREMNADVKEKLLAFDFVKR